MEVLNCVQSRVDCRVIPLFAVSLRANEEEVLVVDEVVTQLACVIVTCSEVTFEAVTAGEGRDEVAASVVSASRL